MTDWSSNQGILASIYQGLLLECRILECRVEHGGRAPDTPHRPLLLKGSTILLSKRFQEHGAKSGGKICFVCSNLSLK